MRIGFSKQQWLTQNVPSASLVDNDDPSLMVNHLWSNLTVLTASLSSLCCLRKAAAIGQAVGWKIDIDGPFHCFCHVCSSKALA